MPWIPRDPLGDEGVSAPPTPAGGWLLPPSLHFPAAHLHRGRAPTSLHAFGPPVQAPHPSLHQRLWIRPPPTVNLCGQGGTKGLPTLHGQSFRERRDSGRCHVPGRDIQPGDEFQSLPPLPHPWDTQRAEHGRALIHQAPSLHLNLGPEKAAEPNAGVEPSRKSAFTTFPTNLPQICLH